ncbi:rRNA maturation RNase YbeY [Xylanibacillus composti]|uniref:Endoribonuclease YbeY n=1 Tax=Xylanibacillus composti TaxID=1572762 RepID=A0A8J4M104_9BACL|nr:rRNA maturation RNase YbeY [Xylanibacillus composti]MDT9724418.1 rRNA maturation RNase YbeY [Xylanibacillus composti]GIQ68014.1 endoribonuclease YbeY [Xylanibacillus composti]
MTVKLEWTNEQEQVALPGGLGKLLDKLLAAAARQEGLESGIVSLTFIDNDAIQQLNRDYRGIDRPTDVLSFALTEMTEEDISINYDELELEEEETALDESDGELLGDILISVPKALEQSEEYGHSLERELGFLFVHGLLHLLGYDHGSEQEEKEMFAKQEHLLQQAGLSR